MNSAVLGYKINIQKSISVFRSSIFLYASSEHVDTEIKNILSFIIIHKIFGCKFNKTYTEYVFFIQE